MVNQKGVTTLMPTERGFAPILVVILIAISVLIGGYFVYQSSQTKLPPETSKPSAVPSSRACTQEAKLCPDGSNVGRTGPNCEFSPCLTSESTESATRKENTEFKPLSYDFYTKNFLELVNYPTAMTSLSRNSLKNISCSERVIVHEDKFELIEGIPERILDELLNRDAAAFILCELADSYILIYENWGGGGGSSNIAHVATITKEFTFTYITMIPREGAYFGCLSVHAVTNNLYIECGGSDVGYSYSLYEVDLANKAKTRLLNCYTEFPSSNMISEICKDSQNKTIYNDSRKFP